MTETPENIVRAGLDHVVERPDLSVLRQSVIGDLSLMDSLPDLPYQA